jgi:hypothetical protein
LLTHDEAGRVEAAIFIANHFVALRHAITREIGCNLRAKNYVGPDIASEQSPHASSRCGPCAIREAAN